MYRGNQNFLCIAYGPTGSGKSYTTIKCCEALDPNFTVDNIVFDSEQFIRLINSGRLKQGSAVLFEELGVAANARNWYKDENVWLSYITQVFRTLNLIVFYTVPKLEFVDMQIAKLCHAQIEALKVDIGRKKTIVKIYDPVQFYPKQNRWYRHYPTYKRDGKTYKIARYFVGRPSLRTVRAYETKRDAYLRVLSAQAQSFFGNAKTIKSERARLDKNRMGEIVAQIVRDKTQYMDDRRFYQDKVERTFEVGGANARRIKGAVVEELKRIGYAITWR